MLAIGHFSFSAGAMLYAAVVLVGGMVVLLVWRKPEIPRTSIALIVMGSVCLAGAVGWPEWVGWRRGVVTVTVMVDLSPSTRGAEFRDGGKLRARVRELVGDLPVRVVGFADENHSAELSVKIEEIAVDRTKFVPEGERVLLFSDCRFEIPSSGPAIYIVVDPELEDVQDCAVKKLELRGDKVAATIAGDGKRVVWFQGVKGAATEPSNAGVTVVTREVEAGAGSVSVGISGGDLWPENDEMSLRVNKPVASERWWVGEGGPGVGWRNFAAGDLPTDPGAYLGAGVIVLNNVGARDLSPGGMDRLGQYVRDLGGAVLIVGGDHAFAAGGYPGTALEAISPLSSSPPRATMLWMLLVDSSGSMGDDAGGTSRWNLATGAMVRVLPMLPPEDRVEVGQFSDVLRWWPVGKNAGETAKMSLPPADAGPHGPTNLEPALKYIGEDADATTPKQLLLISDCDAPVDDALGISELFKKKKIQLHVLALSSDGSGLAALREVARATGGAVVEQLDPKQWIDSVAKLMQSALPERIERSTAHVEFVDGASGIGAMDAAMWNRTWLKADATALGNAKVGTEQLAMAARWRVGRGEVAAVAFALGQGNAESLAGLIAMKPRDPRFAVSWETGERLRVSVDAVDGKTYLNDLGLTLELDDAETGAMEQADAIGQTGPGHYEISIDAPRRPMIATVRHEGAMVDRIAVAGRYAPEFDAVGNDHGAMEKLAEMSGGKVVWPGDHGRIDFRGSEERRSLVGWFCGVGGLLIAGGLVRWRVGD